ncbi:MAG: hypothetical protein ACRBCS_10595 [Cellvibrionaceae bacterium]
MNTVYAIRPDYDNYNELDLEANDFIDSFPEEFSYQDANSFDELNLSLASFWPKMATGFYEIEGEKRKIPDVSVWRNTCLILSPDAYRYLYEELKAYGEFLSIWIDGAEWKILNCITTAEAIPEKTTENQVVFDSYSVSNKYVFKCLHRLGLGLYCTDKLKKLIEDFGLKGIRFVSEEPQAFEDGARKFSIA